MASVALPLVSDADQSVIGVDVTGSVDTVSSQSLYDRLHYSVLQLMSGK